MNIDRGFNDIEFITITDVRCWSLLILYYILTYYTASVGTDYVVWRNCVIDIFYYLTL